MTAKDELAKLRREVEELKAKISPPKSEPFVPPQRYDPTAGMCMPPSALREMVNAIPDHMIRDIAMRDNRAPTGRPGMIPSSQQPASSRPSGDGTGWAREIPLGPSSHQRYVDTQLDAQDAKDRAELIERDANLKAMDKLSERSERLQTLIEQNKKLMEKIK